MGWAAASAAAATRRDAGHDDAGSTVVTAVNRGKEDLQLKVVAPRHQLPVVEPLKWAECARPTDTSRMARTGDDRHRRPACVGTYGRTAADRAGAAFLRSDAAQEKPCCRNGRSSHSPTPRGQRAKGGRLCTERPPKRCGTPPPAAPVSKNGRVPAAGTEEDGRQEQRSRAYGAAAAANNNGGREKARGHERPPSRDAARPRTKITAAIKHERSTSPLPRCNGGCWRRWRPHARTRMHTAPFSAPNGSQPRGGCPRRCDPAHKWSPNRVYPKRK